MNKYIEKENYYIVKVLNTKNEGEFYIDKDDYNKIKNHCWFIKDGKGYVSAKINNKTVKLHRFLLNVTDKKSIVDHIDRNIFNCRKSNLRITNSTINNTNCSFSKNNTSGRTGVYYTKSKNKENWRAQATYNNIRKVKSFSIKKYGFKEAYDLACKCRSNWEKEFNITTETHKIDRE